MRSGSHMVQVLSLILLVIGAGELVAEQLDHPLSQSTEWIKKIPSIEFTYKSKTQFPFLPGSDKVEPFSVTGSHEFKYKDGKFFYQEVLTGPKGTGEPTIFAFDGKFYQTLSGIGKIMNLNRDEDKFEVDRLKYLPITLPYNFLPSNNVAKFKPMILMLDHDWEGEFKHYGAKNLGPDKIGDINVTGFELNKIDRKGESQTYKLYFTAGSFVYPIKWESTDRSGMTQSVLVKKAIQLPTALDSVTIPISLEYRSHDEKGVEGIGQDIDINEASIKIGAVLDDNAFEIPSSFPNYVYDQDLSVWLKRGANQGSQGK